MSTENSSVIRYARRVAVRVKRDQVENFLSKMREIFPSLKREAGIRRMYLLRNPGENNNEFVSLTLWNNKSYADAYGNDSFTRNTESIRDFLEGEPSLTEFDVELHDVNAEDLPPPKTAVRKSIAVKKSKRPKATKKKKNKKRKSR
jgi:heme-degrading monooxygenase HmoA